MAQSRLRAEWRDGPRTPAWDALWRRIFADAHAEAGAAGGAIDLDENGAAPEFETGRVV